MDYVDVNTIVKQFAKESLRTFLTLHKDDSWRLQLTFPYQLTNGKKLTFLPANKHELLLDICIGSTRSSCGSNGGINGISKD
jgi:hypothetical protein